MSLRIRILLVLFATAAAAGTSVAGRDTVTFSGLSFSPALITITEGDTVVFVLSAIHNAVEVSQSTWNANGTTPLGGGFSVPFGGGEVVPSGVGTHYYICTNHAASSMKGRIIVDPAGPPPATIAVSVLVDRDGSLGTTSDRMAKPWSFKIYKDSVGSGIVADSVDSGYSLLADSLAPGTYVVVEADSAHWTHISQIVDGIPQGPTGSNQRTFTVASNDVRTIEFLNYAPNVVISDGFTFSPSTITVDSSDTVRFVLDPMHNVREVDSTTWAADDTVSNGGFELPFGGGEVVLSVPGTLRYVCVPHAVVSMKGTIIVKATAALSLPVAEGWNLLSMPLVPDDSTVAAIYPTATSAAFTYQAGYQSQSAVSPGKGYWLKFGSAQSVNLDGGILAADTVEVSQGWNIVGTISAPVPVSSIASEPGGIVTSSFFGYDAGYFTADTLQPGYGYWVKAGSAGALILQSSPGAEPDAGLIRIVPLNEVPRESRPRE